MQVQAVRSLPFHSEVITDGKIAYDADRLTPVYSPFSGRVTQLVAPLGAKVRRGAPLFRLQAAEYAQGASDLVTAQTQLRLNTLIEQRRHAQYLSRGASLQDWQQAQSDLAQSHSTLSAVRGRLRILGLSAAQIDALAAGGAAMGADATAQRQSLAGHRVGSTPRGLPGRQQRHRRPEQHDQLLHTWAHLLSIGARQDRTSPHLNGEAVSGAGAELFVNAVHSAMRGRPRPDHGFRDHPGARWCAQKALGREPLRELPSYMPMSRDLSTRCLNERKHQHV